MERPNFDFNFDLDCTADHQKEMEEMSKKKNGTTCPRAAKFSFQFWLRWHEGPPRTAEQKGCSWGRVEKHKTKDAILAT